MRNTLFLFALFLSPGVHAKLTGNCRFNLFCNFSPVFSPVKPPVKPPTRAPVKPPTLAPVTPAPTLAPVKPPTLAPVKPPTLAPVTPAPTLAPVLPLVNTTIAVIGDWPYTQTLLDNRSRLIDSVNGDATVELFAHLGDIHSGSMPCTGAGVNLKNVTVTSTATGLNTRDNPIVNPSFNTHVYNAFQQFKSPVIYTPGDNEWADCHKTKQFLSGAPLAELAAVRELFFAKPGRSLGLSEKSVTSQASSATEADKKFIENVMWKDNDIVFATFNLPGGSNDNDPVSSPWGAPFTDATAQGAERTEREAANLRWMAATFALASAENAKAVVIMTQADLWDTEKYTSPGLSNYRNVVQAMASLALAFDKPVLVLNGDSHAFRTDSPLLSNNGTAPIVLNCDLNVADPCDLSKIHEAVSVPKLRRIVVKGSGEVGPTVWLKLTINPNAASTDEVFTFANVCYDNCS